MEQLFIEVEHEHFLVEFEERGGWYDGTVYPIAQWESASTDEKSWSFVSKTSGGDTHDELNDDCRIMFCFLFCWRGVWEGRLYFKDDEYWSNELMVMAKLWEKIEPIIKDKIGPQEE